ncbi:hypothetical protein K461DRAFT_219471 [Myriangium duriaei CBS 260.36]|uniref:SnoaL-like domain-containing protein n=1 Tax=Myriangium duriaei CBS 260.36 TaxID=1168546 RepID=A0A9P4J8M9_9PEZI|nr:hypothetical protein K461DRAFT_219471 [Myriangium duriaei CBS 260.36]
MSPQTNKDDFFTHLRQRKTFHILITGETDDFDALVIDDWRSEGFNVKYLAFGKGGADYVRQVQKVADGMVGVSEKYAIIAFGNPGAPLLTSLRHLPRLAALISYYPPQIPSGQHTTYPPGVNVLLHLCAGSTISVSLRSFVYEGVSSGFAETDVDEFDSVGKELAWSRSLATVRKSFDLENPDLEGVRDAYFDNVGTDPDGSRSGWPQALPESGTCRINLPTLTGGFDREGLRAFYRDLFGPTAHMIRAKLISRTVGPTQVVDEMIISFKHDAVIEWMLPRVPPTGKQVRIPVVSIVAIKAGRCVSERLYWDQASVLVQIGMLDPALIPDSFRTKNKGSIKKLRMPVVSTEQAKAVEEGEDWNGSVNSLVDGMRGSSIS